MHKCLRCGKVYGDDAPELINGCSCGSKYFLFYRSEPTNISEVEQDIRDIVEQHYKELFDKHANKKVVVFDIESIVVPKPGTYLLDLDKLFKDPAVVFKVSEGKYYIDLSKLIPLKRNHSSKG